MDCIGLFDYVDQEDEKTDSHPMCVAFIMHITHCQSASDSKAGRKYAFWVYCFKNSGILHDYHNTKVYNNMSVSDHNITNVIVKNRIKAYGNKNRLYVKWALFLTRIDHALVSIW